MYKVDEVAFCLNFMLCFFSDFVNLSRFLFLLILIFKCCCKPLNNFKSLLDPFHIINFDYMFLESFCVDKLCQTFDRSFDLSFRIAFASNCLAAFNFDVCCFPNAQSCVSLPLTVTHKVQVSSPNVL